MLKRFACEKGFTLIEMMIVLLIISILLLIAIPKMDKNASVANSKGCQATVKLLQSQVAAYEIEKGKAPNSLADLSEYVDHTECHDGSVIEYDKTTREVKAVAKDS